MFQVTEVSHMDPFEFQQPYWFHDKKERCDCIFKIDTGIETSLSIISHNFLAADVWFAQNLYLRTHLNELFQTIQVILKEGGFPVQAVFTRQILWTWNDGTPVR